MNVGQDDNDMVDSSDMSTTVAPTSSSSMMDVTDDSHSKQRKRKSAAYASSASAAADEEHDDKRSRSMIDDDDGHPLSLTRLNLDVLSEIISHLKESELCAACTVSKDWYDAVKTAPTLKINSHTRNLLMIPTGSAVAVHITEASELEPTLKSTPTFWQRLAWVLPNLTQLSCDISEQQLSGANRIVFPPLLESFSSKIDLRGVPQLLAALLPLPSLKKLSLYICGSSPNGISDLELYSSALPHPFTSLEVLDLKFLVIKSDEMSVREDPLSRSVVQFLRQLQLTKLSFLVFPPRLLTRMFGQLLEDGMLCPLFQSGKLTNVQGGDKYILDPALLRMFVRIPSLTSLGSMFCGVEAADLQLLSQLPKLAELDFGHYEFLDGTSQPEKAEKVITACKHAPNLEFLALENCELTTENLHECLSYLPQLTGLDLNDCENITSLAPLSQFDLPRRLTTLGVQACSIRLEDMSDYVLPLRNLETLVLTSPYGQPLPGLLEDQLFNLPKLKECMIGRNFG